ncbi:hypothetical protein AVDCRST_MAG94-3338 [uncultured Leptolyngbya sp.]|uniref:Uncharacterized protein n=1 Tax=uncultured Leptolyngbya sp. TaxID=332963 RepID=A0A6J4MHW9_9CYAN|nr:hypothetical protein AVDCRST_MAG94-3338 [uncultured Leptolyngbya sp.]
MQSIHSSPQEYKLSSSNASKTFSPNLLVITLNITQLCLA